MFYYLGAKRTIAHLYPKPKFSKIFEPFAGTAAYALKYFDREVVLVDKYEIIINVWKYLQQSSEKDILSLPELKTYDSLNDHKLSETEKQFMGFIIADGLESPRINVSKFGNRHNDKVARRLKRISKELFKIRHWNFVHGDYQCLANVEVTYFIDPPYVKGGQDYIHSNKFINYQELAEWCQTRNGQVIVCENSSSENWLPFIDLCNFSGSFHKTKEVFWTNEKVEYQSSLF